MVAAAFLAGCANQKSAPNASRYENFNSEETHSRAYGATGTQACEAARRALLSQGYLISTATAEAVIARKGFQPTREMHVEIEMRVVCARENDNATTAIVFVTATEDRYALKKSSSSASVGVGALGSLSLPLGSSDDSLVKVESETVTEADFYERFYALIDRYLEKAAN